MSIRLGIASPSIFVSSIDRRGIKKTIIQTWKNEKIIRIFTLLDSKHRTGFMVGMIFLKDNQFANTM
jgi:hypothetical protein